MAKSSSARNHRNNPYVLDRAFVRVHYSAAGTLFRFRTELAAVTAATTGGWALAKAVTVTWAVLALIRWQLRRKALAVTRPRVVVTRPWEHTGSADRPHCLACGGTGTVLRAIRGGQYQPGVCPVCEPVRRAG